MSHARVSEAVDALLARGYTLDDAISTVLNGEHES
jgi:hypothetical protein